MKLNNLMKRIYFLQIICSLVVGINSCKDRAQIVTQGHIEADKVLEKNVPTDLPITDRKSVV